MARIATITLTPKEAALLFTIVTDTMDNTAWSKVSVRVARSVHAKVTAALIATQKEVGS